MQRAQLSVDKMATLADRRRAEQRTIARMFRRAVMAVSDHPFGPVAVVCAVSFIANRGIRGA